RPASWRGGDVLSSRRRRGQRVARGAWFWFSKRRQRGGSGSQSRRGQFGGFAEVGTVQLAFVLAVGFPVPTAALARLLPCGKTPTRPLVGKAGRAFEPGEPGRRPDQNGVISPGHTPGQRLIAHGWRGSSQRGLRSGAVPQQTFP